MALTSDPNLRSTQELITRAEKGGNVKASTTSTASLSSSTSKEGGSCNSRKARRGGIKRKASERSSPYVQTAPSKPPPIVRRLSADKSHFKDIVHQFTGLPCPPPLPRVPMLSPTCSTFLAAAIAQSLQTLDTISAYLLLHGSSQENKILLNELNKSKSLTFLQALKNQDGRLMGTFTPSGMGPPNSSSTIGGVALKSNPIQTSPIDINPIQTCPKDINLGMSGDPPTNMPIMHKCQQIAQLESVLLKDSNTSDNFFSLAWVLLKQMASTPLAL